MIPHGLSFQYKKKTNKFYLIKRDTSFQNTLLVKVALNAGKIDMLFVQKEAVPADISTNANAATVKRNSTALLVKPAEM